MQESDTEQSTIITRQEIIDGLMGEANDQENPGSTRVSAWKELNAIKNAQERQAATESSGYEPPNIWITIEDNYPDQDEESANGDDPSISD